MARELFYLANETWLLIYLCFAYFTVTLVLASVIDLLGVLGLVGLEVHGVLVKCVPGDDYIAHVSQVCVWPSLLSINPCTLYVMPPEFLIASIYLPKLLIASNYFNKLKLLIWNLPEFLIASYTVLCVSILDISWACGVASENILSKHCCNLGWNTVVIWAEMLPKIANNMCWKTSLI